MQIEGNIIPIITSMVTSDEKNNKLLDMSSDEIHEIKSKIKKKLSECLNYDGPIKDKFNSMFTKESIYAPEDNSENSDEESNNIYECKENEECSSSESSEDNRKEEEYPIYELLDKIGNPLNRMKRVLVLLKDVIKNLQSFLSEDKKKSILSFCSSLTYSYLCSRFN